MKKKFKIPKGFVLVTKANYKQHVDELNGIIGGMFLPVDKTTEWQQVNLVMLDGTVQQGAAWPDHDLYPVIAPKKITPKKKPSQGQKAFSLLKKYRASIKASEKARWTNDKDALNIALAVQETLENQIDKLLA